MSVYVIAEIGINHNGRLDLCHRMVDAAAQAGCDAVKLQLFHASTLYPRTGGELDWKDAEKAYSYDIYTAVEGFETPLSWIEPLQKHCTQLGIDLLASVFDRQSLHTILRVGLPRLKLASSVLTHLPLLEMCASSGLPCLLSTGGASLGEIERAVDIILTANPALPPQDALTLLHCRLQYPTPPEDCHLGVLRTLALAFPHVGLGYSDHSMCPVAAPYQAVLLGAQVIEKHITLDRKMEGPDHFFAVEPHDLCAMVRALREAERLKASPAPPELDAVLYGSTAVGCTTSQRSLRNFVYPVLFTHAAIDAGERITAEHLAVLRPAKKTRGLEAEHLPLLHRHCVTAHTALAAETALGWEHIFPLAPHSRVLLLRADAHKGVGTGDLASFIALARHLEPRGFECHFCTRATAEGLRLLASYGVDAARIHALDAHLPVEAEVQLTQTLAQRLEADVVLVQVTDRPVSAYARMDFADRRVIKGCVSFEEATPQGFDLVWSWDVTVASGYDTVSQPHTHWFLGPEYVVLPPEFTAADKARVQGQPRQRLLVVMGGGDALDLTSAVARKLMELGNPLHTTFVLGSGYAHEQALRTILKNADYSWEIRKQVSDMLSEYLTCDVCIAAGGLTASELASTGTPALLIAACGHQDSRCELFARQGWAKYLGTAEDWELTRDALLHFTPNGTTPFVHRLGNVLDCLDKLTEQTGSAEQVGI